MMQPGVVVIGMGEIGAVVARGFLRLGMPVYPVVRDTDMARAAREWPMPQCVVIATGEAELAGVLAALPGVWRDRTVLLQNELLPRDWEPFTLGSPTVISIWFEKKKGQDVKVLLASPVWGPAAQTMVKALNSVDVPARVVSDAREILYELVRKNVYILTTNIAGLQCGGDVNQLWTEQRALAEAVAQDVMDVQAYLTGMVPDRVRLVAGLEEGIRGDLQHKCQGRTAPARLTRMIAYADSAGLAIPTARGIFKKYVANQK